MVDREATTPRLTALGPIFVGEAKDLCDKLRAAEAECCKLGPHLDTYRARLMAGARNLLGLYATRIGGWPRNPAVDAERKGRDLEEFRRLVDYVNELLRG